MKKTLAYTATAVLLGFAVMMLPLAMQTGPPTYQPELKPFASPLAQETSGNVPDASAERSYGLGQPLDLLPSSLVLLSGLIVALSVYAILKKQAVV